MYQATLRSEISINGVGVHSGNPCGISIFPAPEDYGVVYIRKDIDQSKNLIVANYKNVSETNMCTKVSNQFNIGVSVIEHLSAAFYSLGITNAIVKTNGEEIPLLDGSALPFVKAISSAGIQKQSKEKKTLKITKTIKVGDDKRWAALSPSDSFIINIECDYLSKGLRTAPFSYNASIDNFEQDIAAARTFGFFSDADYLRKNNLALGASLENTIVFDDNGIPINKNGLRYSNEPIRHKILDVIGDLSLSQYEIIGRYDGFCPGHQLNNQLLVELFRDYN